MSRRRKPYREALEEALADVERLDFIESQSGAVNHTEKGFYFHSREHPHAGYDATARGAIDKAIAAHHDRQQEERRWTNLDRRLARLVERTKKLK